MYTELQIKFIERFGRKEQTFGCLVINGDGDISHIVGDTNMDTILDDQGFLVREEPDEMVGIKEILGHEPHLFPDVARLAKEKGYRVEVLAGDMLIRLIRISRWDIKNPRIIEFKDTMPLLDQPKVMEELLDLFPEKK